jgi:hypothetical protein
MIEDPRWKMFHVSQAYLVEKSQWLAEQRSLRDSSLIFFMDASKLLNLSRFDYSLCNLALFLAILGVERALKLHYKNETGSFKLLLQRAVTERVISDSIFHRIDPLPKNLLHYSPAKSESYSDRLVSLIPNLRNTFFHGTYLLFPQFLILTLQMREIADALDTRVFYQKS